jgi:MFS family permease
MRTVSDLQAVPLDALSLTQSRLPEAVELEDLEAAQPKRVQSPTAGFRRVEAGEEKGEGEEGNLSDSSGYTYSDREDIENAQLLGEPSTRQMKRKNGSVKRRSANRPNLAVEIHENGNGNGHPANGDMNSHTEVRRKDASLESTLSHTARLMSRSSFSLDQEPPPSPHSPNAKSTSFRDLPVQDQRNFLLLVLLYFLQGVPMGLAMGSVPFLLKKHLSYGQIGVFSLASYPYSLKLLWSPIVDAVWSKKFGRRKSWITPIQTISGITMIYLSSHVEAMMTAAEANDGSGVWNFTWWWFFLVFLCATQDIAVDGWAISLLTPQNIAYASTAQTVGLTGGNFLSYTVFLAFNSADFANRWFRNGSDSKEGLMSLGGYLAFWGWAYLIVTLGLALMKKEDRSNDRDGIVDVYKSMWGVLKLRHIQTIIIVHLIGKLGFQANDAVTNLKLIDKGFGQDNLALVVLIDFPIEMALGYYAGKWSTVYTPTKIWCWAFIGRLIAAMVAQFTVMICPAAPMPAWYLLVVIGMNIFSTVMNTIMFVAVSAFHAKIADPAIGGTYMTLLAT